MAAGEDHSATTAATGAARPPEKPTRPPRRTQSLQSALARYGLLFVLLPNLPFWLLAPRMGVVTPGLLNLDALLLGVLSPWITTAWLVGLYAMDLFLEVVYGIHATYGVNYVEIFYSMRYGMAVVSPSQWLAAAGAMAAIIVVVGAAWAAARPRVSGCTRTWFVIAVLAVLIPVAVLTHSQRARATAGREAAWKQGHITTASLAPRFVNIASSALLSPALSLYHAWTREHIWGWLRGEFSQTIFAPSAASHATAWLARSQGHPNLVLVLTESWGLANNPALRRSLAAPFQSATLLKRYHLAQGTVGFHGTTAGGELRELCNDRLAVATAPLSMSPQVLSQCLAWKMDQNGYDSLAVDSAMRFWPGGASWYRLLGFQHTMDFEDFHRLGLSTFIAGPFRSTPDAEVAAWIAGELSQPQPRPRLFFWLTMSAHLPVHQPLPAEYTANCAIAPVTQAYAGACGWYKVELRTLQAIAAAANAPQLTPTVFLVVGDHAPPFVTAARAGFSQTEVPYVLLTPAAAP